MSHQPVRELSRARRWSATIVLSASLLVITMDMTILSLALPFMAADLDPTAEQQLWIIDIYSLILAGLLIPAAAISDRVGRRRMLFAGYASFAVASLLILVAPTAGSVIAIRALLGLGGSFIMPATLSLIRVIFTDPRERATALGVWAAVSGLGAAIGPLVGGVLLEHFSWHSAFLINVPLMVVAVIAGLILIPESRVANPGRLDITAAVVAMAGMVSLVWGIKQFGQKSTFALPGAWAALTLAAVLLTHFVVRSRRSDSPLLQLELFRSRSFSAGIIAALTASFALIAALVLTAQWLQIVYGASPIRAGVLLIPMAIAAAVASVGAPYLAGRIGRRAVLAGGLAIAAAGLLVLAISGVELTVLPVLVSISVIGIGMGSLAVGSDLIMSGSPEELAGNASALEEAAYELGGTLGVSILGSISALVYRSRVTDSEIYREIYDDLPDVAVHAGESLGAAAAIADELDAPGLVEVATGAFDRSLQVAGLVGGLLLFAVAALVFILAPKGAAGDPRVAS